MDPRAIIEFPDADVHSVLRLAFGRHVEAMPLPVPAGQSERGLAYALQGPDVPPRVLLLRYPLRVQAAGLHEYTALQALSGSPVPVPAVYYMGWGRATPALWLLIEYVYGRGDLGQPHAFMARIGPHFAQTLAALHRLDWPIPPDLPLRPFHLTFNELMVRVHRLQTPQLLAILRWLTPQMAHISERPRTLIHGAYTPQNVLADGTRIVAVHGWEYAALADPRFDVGHTSAVLGAYGTALSDRFIEHYEAAAGPVPERAFWEVFGALQLLSRVAHSLSTLRGDVRQRVLDQLTPVWENMLRFVEDRSGQYLL